MLYQELEELSNEFPDQFKLTFIIDKALKPGWKYPTGYVTKDLLEKHLPKPSKETYILTCGPPIMCTVVENLLFNELGYDKDEHYFKF